MAVFNFGGNTVDTSDAKAFVQAAKKSGVTVGGSIVAGDAHIVSGGTVTGTVRADKKPKK